MLRQRLATTRSPLSFVGRLLFVLLCLALVWYGLMAILLAATVAPDTVNSISGYRTAYDFLAGLKPDDFTGSKRVIVAGSGLLAFLVFGYLALKEIPRPQRTRTDLPVIDDDRGSVTIEPRAIERVAESAAVGNPIVAAAAGRLGDEELTVNVELRRSADLPQNLENVQTRVREALAQHDLPALPVNVTLAGYSTPTTTKRELK